MNTLKQEKLRPGVVEATYTESSMPQFKGNQLIEALPDFLSYPTCEIQKRLSSMPEPLVNDASNVQKAMWLARSASKLFVVEGRQIALFEMIDFMIRTGYSHRNPDRSEHEKYLSDAYRRMQSGERIIVKFGKDRLQPTTVAVIGCSGVGKSLAVERILKLYPQVISHPQSTTMDPFDQVVYIKTECPPDGSVKSLCKAIIGKIEEATGLDYSSLYQPRRTAEDDLRRAVVRTLSMHSVGILIIDEMQNLVLSRKNKEEFFNLIVSLANSLEVPVLYVGTPKVLRSMKENFRVTRLFATWGVRTWTPLKFDDGEWNSFYEKLCNLYVLEEPLEAKKIEQALFDLSQGVVAIMVNLFILAQMQAMVLGEKTLTVETLKDTDEMYFSHMHPLVDALRRNDTDALNRYEDLRYTPEDFKDDFRELQEKLA